jgi:transcriptional regulator with XRE-family HTH domain
MGTIPERLYGNCIDFPRSVTIQVNKSITSEVHFMENLVKIPKKQESIGEMLRFWRQLNRKSQMDLALDVDVSSKHLSFVETGKSKPSRHLVLKIAQSLKLPLRHRNAFLLAAGYAPEFEEEPFDGPKMEIVREALHRMLNMHEPYPAFVVNTGYKILMTNSGYDQMVTFFAGENALTKYDNAIRILFSEDGLRPYVKDWPAIEQFLLARLWEEVVSTQNSELVALYQEIARLATSKNPVHFEMDHNLPVMSLVLEKKAEKASFFTTITTLGTPLDLTTQELRIELLFPSDDATKRMFPLDDRTIR